MKTTEEERQDARKQCEHQLLVLDELGIVPVTLMADRVLALLDDFDEALKLLEGADRMQRLQMKTLVELGNMLHEYALGRKK